MCFGDTGTQKADEKTPASCTGARATVHMGSGFTRVQGFNFIEGINYTLFSESPLQVWHTNDVKCCKTTV